MCLGGCYATDKRYGIDPVLQPAAVETSTNNQLRILAALAADAGVPVGIQPYWYEVSKAGFNYIDDECRLYFNELFFLNRDRDQLKAGIAAAGATTAAILGLTNASAKSIAIVAQAFGLGAVSTDIVAGTYLYQIPPATAQSFVRELQLAYREGAAARQALINTPTAAYEAIQGYLSLCLPPTIEAKIAEHVATARAFPEPAIRGGASFGIVVTSPPPVTRVQMRASIIRDVGTPLPKPIRAPEVSGENRIGRYEASMSQKDIKAAQTVLCVAPTGDLGPVGSVARQNLQNYLISISRPPSDHITPDVWVILRRLIREGKHANC